MTTNVAYWRDRFTALEKADRQDILKHIKNIDKYYNRAANSLSKDVKYWYSKVAENNNISYAAALKLMKADELEEFHWTLEEYIEYAKLNGLDARVTKQLVNASARVHLSYYEELKTELLFGVEKVAAQLKKEVEDLLSEKTIDSYLKTAYEIQKGSGSGWYVKPDVNKLKTLVTTPWFGDGEVFSSRIWKNKNMLVYNLQREITFMIMRGNAPNKAAVYIAKTMQTAKYNAYRLVQTEEAAISALARRQCYKDLGVEEFEVVETLDGHTCEKCAGMDGKHFPMKEYQVGLTAPPFHPNCRGTTCPYFSDGLGTRAARDTDGNAVELPADTTYEKWKQKFVDISENDDTMEVGAEASAADPRDELDKIDTRSVQTIQHGFSAFSEDDILSTYIKDVVPEEGYYDVAMHGTNTAVAFGGYTANMSPRTLANFIRSREDYTPGENIRLLSCSTGKIVDGEMCFAEELANALGVSVKAPNDVLIIRPKGVLQVSYEKVGMFVEYIPNQRRRIK